jgi:hypothetical protein
MATVSVVRPTWVHNIVPPTAAVTVSIGMAQGVVTLREGTSGHA